ncbi:hypothetical protein MMC25_007418 [Agyrium rufum]|nr:hypothetical protein [Agyrium rufum]
MPLNQPPLVRFYDSKSQSKDPKGRTLASIQAWPDSKLEQSHDYIQILFPLPEGSPFNTWAPVIDAPTCHAFRTRPDLRANLRKSLDRMLDFYGFTLYESTPDTSTVPLLPSSSSPSSMNPTTKNGATPTTRKVTVHMSPHFSEASESWLVRFDHNHLRMTRMIRCLRVLGLEAEAGAFYAALKQVHGEFEGRISAKTMMFWTRAAERPLFLAPEDERDQGSAAGWLYALEGVKKGGGRQNGEAEDDGEDSEEDSEEDEDEEDTDDDDDEEDEEDEEEEQRPDPRRKTK